MVIIISLLTIKSKLIIKWNNLSLWGTQEDGNLNAEVALKGDGCRCTADISKEPISDNMFQLV